MQAREKLLTVVGGAVFATGMFGLAYEATDMALSGKDYVPHLAPCAASESACAGISNVDPLAHKLGNMIVDIGITGTGGVLIYRASRDFRRKEQEAYDLHFFNMEWFNYYDGLKKPSGE